MSSRLRTTFLSLVIIIVIVFSAAAPLTVYADDGTPPEATTTPVTEPTQPEAGSEGTLTESATNPQPTGDTATPAPASEPQPVVDAAVPVDPAVPAEGQAVVDPNATILSDVPANTEVTVLDASGNAQPLVTQEAADAIATSDPIWCPGSQAPTPGQNGCTGSFPSFHELLTYLSGNSAFQGAGTIYVQQGEYQGNDPDNTIDFSSPDYDLSNIETSNLSVTGGWNPATNAIDPNTPSTFTNYSIIIGSLENPWGGSLTISNLVIVEAPDYGIKLYSDEDVNMRNTRVDRSRQTGALIRAGGNVAVRDSIFGNGDTFEWRRQIAGLDIVSGESTSLFNVIASDNYKFGANIEAGGRVTIGGLVNSNSTFSGNQYREGTLANPTFGGYGLQIITPDSIEIDYVTANNNYLWGALLDAGGDIAISNSVFNNNSTDQPGFIDDTGLFITGGMNTALDNVTANANRLYGAQINVDGTVSIKNSNFNDNRGVTTIGGVTEDHGIGLQVTTLSDILINNTNALNNTLFGGDLTAGGLVAVSGGSFSNTSTDPTSTAIVGEGLRVKSTGTASLANVVFNNNQTAGADIQAGGDIFLDNVTAVDNGTTGVMVQGTCTHVNGGLYSGNGQYGIDLGNSALDLVSPPIFVNNGAGNINPAAPVSCAPAISVLPSVIAGTIKAGSSNLFTANFISQAGGSESAKNMSLNSYLANTRTGSTSSNGIFIGEYVYVHSLEGLQIYAVVPNIQLVAMSGS